jgi:hypothetical protein
MRAILSNFVAHFIRLLAPYKDRFILGHKGEAAIIQMRDITTTTPNRVTWFPGPSADLKVGAEQTFQTLLEPATDLAISDPTPECVGIA